MSKRRFTEMSVCVRQQVCLVCRDQDKGRKWREAIAKRYETDGADWPCPRGHDWGSRGLGDTAAKMIKWMTRGRVRPCGGCKKRQALLNKVWPYRTEQRSIT